MENNLERVEGDNAEALALASHKHGFLRLIPQKLHMSKNISRDEPTQASEAPLLGYLAYPTVWDWRSPYCGWGSEVVSLRFGDSLAYYVGSLEDGPFHRCPAKLSTPRPHGGRRIRPWPGTYHRGVTMASDMYGSYCSVSSCPYLEGPNDPNTAQGVFSSST